MLCPFREYHAPARYEGRLIPRAAERLKPAVTASHRISATNENGRKGGAPFRPNQCKLRSPCFLNVRRLWPLGALHNLEFDRVAFLQRPVTVSKYGGVMDKNVWPVFSANEAVSFRVVEPFHASEHFDLPPEGRISCFTHTMRRTPN